MKSVTLTKIKKEVLANGGNLKKEKFYLNGQDAYTINGNTMTKPAMIEAYKRGEL